MKTVTPQLPTILGSFAAMLVAFLGLTNGTSPATCLAKAASAFLVFAGFGLILRFALSEAAADKAEQGTEQRSETYGNSLDVIVPGTSVADLLRANGEESHNGNDDEQAAA